MTIVDLTSLPREAYTLAQTYQDAIEAIKAADHPDLDERIAAIDGHMARGNDAVRELGRVLYGWLDQQDLAILDAIAEPAEGIVAPAILARIGPEEVLNRAYLVLRAYCEDGGLLDFATWVYTRRSPARAG